MSSIHQSINAPPVVTSFVENPVLFDQRPLVDGQRSPETPRPDLPPTMTSFGSLISVGQNWTREGTTSGRQHIDREFRVTAIHDPPYFFIHPQADGSYRYDGFLYHLWLALTSEAGIRYRIIPLEEFNFGYRTINGTWTGMVGELAYGRADFALSELGRIANRESVVDFLDAVPVSWYQHTFYVRRGQAEMPEITSRTFKSLLNPLYSDVWWMLLVSILVLSVCLRATLRFNHPRAKKRRNVEEITWGSCLFNIFLSMVGQGWASTPDSLAARTVTITTWLLGILLHASYTANLMSSLTVVPTGRAIHSLREFAENPDLKLIMDCPERLLKWKNSSDEYERELYRIVLREDRLVKVDPNTWPPFEQTDRILICSDIRRLRHVYGPDSCEFTTMLGELSEPPVMTHIAIANGLSTLRDDLNKVLMLVSESGQVQRLRNYWLHGNQFTCSTGVEFKPLSFINLLAMMLIVPLAVALSLAILALEWLWQRNQESLARKFTGVCQVSGTRGWII